MPDRTEGQQFAMFPFKTHSFERFLEMSPDDFEKRLQSRTLEWQWLQFRKRNTYYAKVGKCRAWVVWGSGFERRHVPELLVHWRPHENGTLIKGHYRVGCSYPLMVLIVYLSFVWLAIDIHNPAPAIVGLFLIFLLFGLPMVFIHNRSVKQNRKYFEWLVFDAYS